MYTSTSLKFRPALLCIYVLLSRCCVPAHLILLPLPGHPSYFFICFSVCLVLGTISSPALLKPSFIAPVANDLTHRICKHCLRRSLGNWQYEEISSYVYEWVCDFLYLFLASRNNAKAIQSYASLSNVGTILILTKWHIISSLGRLSPLPSFSLAMQRAHGRRTWYWTEESQISFQITDCFESCTRQ